MKRNVANKEVTPEFPEFEKQNAKDRAVERLNINDTFHTIFANGDADLIRKRRKQLEESLPLLDKPEQRALCKKLIKFFNTELTARAVTRTHERYLSERL